jgi:hypothetical protein
MEGACQDSIYNTWHLLYMREMVYQHFTRVNTFSRISTMVSRVVLNDVYDSNKHTMLLLKRSSLSQHTRNGFDLVRQWSTVFTDKLTLALLKAFGWKYNLMLLSDQDEEYMNCFECQAYLFSKTDVLIGAYSLRSVHVVCYSSTIAMY